VSTAETIGDVTMSCAASKLPVKGDDFESRVQGGLLADGFNSLLACLFTSPPNTTFSQNNGVIQLTRCASRSAGFSCASEARAAAKRKAFFCPRERIPRGVRRDPRRHGMSTSSPRRRSSGGVSARRPRRRRDPRPADRPRVSGNSRQDRENTGKARCRFWLILFGVFGKLGAAFTSIPICVVGGLVLQAFAMVFVSGMIIATKHVTRRNTFIMMISLARGGRAFNRTTPLKKTTPFQRRKHHREAD